MTLKESILQIVRQEIPISMRLGTVKEVNSDGSCDVEVNNLTLLDVRVNSIIQSAPSGLVPTPKKGSNVIVGLLNNKQESAFILLMEQLDKIQILVDEIVLSGDQFGGLVKSETVAEEVNKNRAEINKLKAIFNSWVPVPMDGGAALKAVATASALTPGSPSVKANYENEKVKHG